MSLKLNSSGGGSVTVQEPTTASNLTLTLPAVTGKAAYTDASDNLQVNSGYGSYATGYVARAWVNFNGTGTVAIRASGNVSSITDNGVGDYIVNFTTAMPDTNYSAACTVGTVDGTAGDTGHAAGYIRETNTTNARVLCWNDADALVDIQRYCATFFR